MKIVVTALALALAAPADAQTVSPAYQNALAAPNRSAEEKARDATRKPAELLAFAGVKPGDKVADFMMGGGYLTKILAGVVGPNGKVYAYQPAQFIAYRAAYADDQDKAVAGLANVVPSRPSLAEVGFPEPLDAVVTVQNWHDLHLNFAPPGFAGSVAKRLFDALKPGGVLLLVDHTANAGDATAPDKLHRIDPGVVKTEIEQAGFVLEAESPMFRLASDPRTTNVFDPSIRGKTDQFVHRYRKPR